MAKTETSFTMYRKLKSLPKENYAGKYTYFSFYVLTNTYANT